MSFWSSFLVATQLSHTCRDRTQVHTNPSRSTGGVRTSPNRSPSRFVWGWFFTSQQLSLRFNMPSLSASASHTVKCKQLRRRTRIRGEVRKWVPQYYRYYTVYKRLGNIASEESVRVDLCVSSIITGTGSVFADPYYVPSPRPSRS